MKLIYGYIGRVKDFRPIFAKKERPAEMTSQKANINNFDIYILPERGDECKCKLIIADQTKTI